MSDWDVGCDLDTARALAKNKEREAISREKTALIESQSAEIDHLRAALEIIKKNIVSGDIKGALLETLIALASYMSADGWVRQLSDGTVVKNDAS